MIKKYLVQWEIELDAESPEHAARHALTIHRNPESIATVFDVTSVQTGKSKRIDLTDLDSGIPE